MVCLCFVQLIQSFCRLYSFLWNILALSNSLSHAIFRSCISLLAPGSRAICQTRSHQAHSHTNTQNHIRVISIRLHMNNRRAIWKYGQHTPGLNNKAIKVDDDPGSEWVRFRPADQLHAFIMLLCIFCMQNFLMKMYRACMIIIIFLYVLCLWMLHLFEQMDVKTAIKVY